MKISIINKPYIPSDNSYCLNLTNETVDYRLAGTMNGEDPKLTKIVSEPYEFNIKSLSNSKHSNLLFVNVEYKGDIIRVLYYESNITNNLKERIKRNNELKEHYDGY